jgi:hypothetical protein
VSGAILLSRNTIILAPDALGRDVGVEGRGEVGASRMQLMLALE